MAFQTFVSAGRKRHETPRDATRRHGDMCHQAETVVCQIRQNLEARGLQRPFKGARNATKRHGNFEAAADYLSTDSVDYSSTDASQQQSLSATNRFEPAGHAGSFRGGTWQNLSQDPCRRRQGFVRRLLLKFLNCWGLGVGVEVLRDWGWGVSGWVGSCGSG